MQGKIEQVKILHGILTEKRSSKLLESQIAYNVSHMGKMDRQDIGLSRIMKDNKFLAPEDPAVNQAGFSLSPGMAARMGVHAADLRKAFPEVMGAKFGVIFAECYPPTPIEAVTVGHYRGGTH